MEYKKPQFLWAFGVILFLFFSSVNLQADLPDLAVQSIETNQNCQIRVVLVNQGGAIPLNKYKTVTVWVIIGGRQMYNARLRDNSVYLTDIDPQMKLKAAGGRLSTILWKEPYTSGQVSVRLDYDKMIPESNENNNDMWLGLRCPSAPEYGEPLIMVDGFRLLPNCCIEVALRNASDKILDPVVYHKTDPDHMNLNLMTNNSVQRQPSLYEVDPDRVLQNPGSKLKYIFAPLKFCDTSNGELVTVEISQVRRSGHSSEKSKKLWCLPDLTVTQITYKPTVLRVGERQWFKVIVKNKGMIPSPPCKLSFLIGGESQPKFFDVRKLKPGETRSYNREASLNKVNSYKIVAFVDVKRKVEEISEKNNKKSIWAKVRKRLL